MRLLDRSGTHRAHHTCSATTVAAIPPPPRAHSTATNDTPGSDALLYPDTIDLSASDTNLKVCFAPFNSVCSMCFMLNLLYLFVECYVFYVWFALKHRLLLLMILTQTTCRQPVNITSFFYQFVVSSLRSHYCFLV